MPAALLALPFAWLPARLAGATFVGLGCAVLAAGVLRRSAWHTILFASAPVFAAARGVQWSPLLVGAAFSLGGVGLTVAKPNLGLPLLAMQRPRGVFVGALVAALLLVVSFAIQPNWLAEWLTELRENSQAVQYVAPIRTLLGLPLALAAFRWRRRDVWLLLAMALTPQNGFFYDQLPLMLIPESRREVLAVTLISLLAYLLALNARTLPADVPTWSAQFFPYMVVGLYWPALVMVLRRPNRNDPIAAVAA